MTEVVQGEQESALSEAYIAARALLLITEFGQVLEQLPEFQKAAAHSFLTNEPFVYFERNGTHYGISTEPFPYHPGYLLIRVFKEKLVIEELTLDANPWKTVSGSLIGPRILHWNSAGQSPKNLQYVPDRQKNTYRAIEGTVGLLGRLKATS